MRTLGDRLGKAKPRLSTTREIRDKRYSPDATIRGWYKSKRWQALREQVLVRDLYTCQRTGVLLTGKAPAPDSPIVHHRIPHKGNEQLFWDINNLTLVSKAWHDSEAQAEERNNPDHAWAGIA
jgi:5-methylcytosine-specific restriction protein A